MLDVIRTTHSRNPWRLAWQGQPLEDVGFARRRDARACQRQLLALADWTVHPDTWERATRCAVVAVLEAVPSVQELERLRQERR
jgi:hypothetical protein